MQLEQDMSGVPLQEWQKLASEFNAIVNRDEEYSLFVLRRLAKEGERLYYQQGQIQAGIIAASCLTSLKKFDAAERLFLELEKYPLDESQALDLAVRHARMLNLNNRTPQAWELIEPYRHLFGNLTSEMLGSVLLASYEGQPDIMEELYKGLSDQDQAIYGSMLFYYWQSTKPYAWRDAFEYAKLCADVGGYGELTLDNLDEFMDDVNQNLSAWEDGRQVFPYAQEIACVRKLLHTFLIYPDDQIYFDLPISFEGQTYTAQVTREYDDSGFSATLDHGDGVIVTDGDTLTEIIERLGDALALVTSPSAA